MPQITDALVLPEDVLLSPVSDLAEKVRQRLDWSEGDVAITRLRSRTPSKIVNAEAACLLEEFRSAATISEAVLRYSAANNVDPHATLNEAFPLLRELVNSQLLVPSGTRQAAQIIESLKPGQQVDGLTIVRCVQSLEDTELYQAREAAGQLCALKVARSPGRSTAALALRREANVLQEIGGRD
ncbi:MAG: hypothetical protein AB8I80_05305, partial [Anaerolineae bacterium]